MINLSLYSNVNYSYQETRSCLSTKVYARDGPCIYMRAGDLRAPEIIRSQ